MKKRINNSEIEKARKSNRALFILTTLMLLVVICGLVFYVLYDKDLINFGNIDNVKKTEKGSIFTDEKINLNDTRVNNLFDIVKVSTNNCENYNLDKSVKVKDMSEKCKFSLVANIYKEKMIVSDVSYVRESDVITAYEKLYGYGTYQLQETIPYLNNNTLLYNPAQKYYFTNNLNGEIGDAMTSFEKIISVEKNKTDLYITSSLLYYNSINKVLCKDYDCEEVIESVENEPNYPDYYDLYIDHNGKKLYQYKYHFKLDGIGFYKYIGFERTSD